MLVNQKSQLLCALLVVLFSLSCNKPYEDYFNPDGLTDHTYWGPIVKMGNGKVRSYFTVSKAGVPLQLGIELTDDALAGLPEDPMDFAHSTFPLAIPQKAKALTAFDHLEVNWNPHGHEPENVYDKPHFDFHFYMMTTSAQHAIPPYSATSAALFDSLPPAGYMPETYVPTPGGVPQMGKHWANTESDEAQGLDFTKTFIYGSYNGAVTFYEPMVTHQLVKSGVGSSTAIAQPKYFAETGVYYPTQYNISTNSKKAHYISLSDFTFKKALN